MPDCALSNMYFQRGGDCILLDIQYFFGGGACAGARAFLQGSALRLVASRALDFCYAFIWGVMENQAAPTQRLPDATLQKPFNARDKMSAT